VRIRGRLSGAIAAWLLGGALLLAVEGVAPVAGAAEVGAPAAGAGVSSPIVLLPGGGQWIDGYHEVLAANWAGYAQHTKNKGTFSGVRDTWTVPKVNTQIPGKQYASDWVGVGGYNDDTLVQVGTTEWNDDGHAGYYAWTEVLPQNVVYITGMIIRPGDKIKATVVERRVDLWYMTLKDVTTDKSYTRIIVYRCSGESAEAIHERPEIAYGLATLAKTNNVPFNPGKFSISAPGHTVWKSMLKSIHPAKLVMILMVNKTDTETLASPSVPNSTRRGFAVAYGATPPQPPN
jgi:Peptidase A4 family